MECTQVRRLLDEGIVPGTATAQQAALGFHIASCRECRLLFRQLHVVKSFDQQTPIQTASPATPALARPRMSLARRLKAAGAAAMVASALALSAVSLPDAAHAQIEAYNTVYVVKPGDTLVKIAEKVYGNGARWQEIYQANRALIGPNPARIFPGQQLTLPALQPSDPSKPVGGSFYTVQRGDTLTTIAAKAYGDASKWTLLYEANRALIGANPARIYPGQQLQVPLPDSRPSPRQYTVQRGDTLVKIAEKVYGNGSRWQEIYQANRSLIGANPALIYAGQQLVIP